MQRLAFDSAFRLSRFGSDVVRAFRKKVQVLLAAKDERDLYALRSLRLERLKGDRAATSSIRLNEQFRLILRFETDSTGRVAVVVELIDYH